jgi:pimeloyl-ACP methyl ester carboxylesterase
MYIVWVSSPSPIQHHTGRASSGDVEIFYRLFGQPGRTPAVILHGVSYFSYDWIDLAAELATGRQIVAMDMRGFGDSGWSKDYSVPAFARDIVALLDHLGWNKAILIGHSMGGRNCTYCAAEYPDRAAGLLLLDWSPEHARAGQKRVTEKIGGTPDSFATIEDAMRFFKIDPDSPRGQSKRPRYQAYMRPVPGGFALKRDPYFRDQFRHTLLTGERPKLGVDMWAALARVACPIQILRGSRSDLFAAETVDRVLATNPRIKLTEVNSGHDVAGDDPDGFLREARAFFEAIDAGMPLK